VSRPQRLGALLGAWNARGTARRAPTRDDTLAAVSIAWESIVGVQIAQRSRPTRCAGGTVTVLTASSSWSAELSFLAPTIVEALRRAVPGADVRRLRFVVASGRSRLLFEGARRRVAPRQAAPRAASAVEPCPSGRELEDAGTLVARLAGQQQSLDAWRERAGWRKCAGCGRRMAPSSAQATECAPCQGRQRARDDARVERVLMQAPWLTAEQARRSVGGLRPASFRRVRRQLRTRWESEIESAQRRLRRGALTPADRVAAWSYLMLLTNMPGRDIGRASVRDVLGAAWTNALFDAAGAVPEEARTTGREKHS
jgi:predicted nucleic acid-binding Zn ribbon protein